MLKKIFTNSVLLLISNIFARFSMFIVNILAAKVLTQEQFGQYMYLRSIVSMFDGVLSASYGNMAIKEISENKLNQVYSSSIINSILIINFILVLLLTLVILIFSDNIISILFLNEVYLRDALYITCLLLFFTILSSLFQKINIAYEQYKELVLASFLISISMLPIIYLLAKEYEFYGLLMSVLFYFFVDSVIKFYLINKKIKLYLPSIENMNSILLSIRNLTKNSQYLIYSSVLTSIIFWLLRTIIINESSSFTAIAIFDAAYQWLVVIMLITGATTSIALQMLSSSINDTGSKISIFRTNLIINIFISLFFAVLFSFFSENIMSIYGDEYLKGYKLIYIISLIAIFATIASIYNKLLISLNKYKVIFYHSFISALISFSSIFCLNEYNDFIRLGLVFLIFYFINSLLDTVYILKNNREYIKNE